MGTTGNIFKVDTIEFESNDHSAILNGIVFNGQMKYNSQLTISNSQLNKVFARLQFQNTDVDIYEMIQSTPMYENETYFEMNASILSDSSFPVHFLEDLDQIKEIRA